MRILITNDDDNVIVEKDYDNLTYKDAKLIAQIIIELELIKKELFAFANSLNTKDDKEIK